MKYLFGIVVLGIVVALGWWSNVLHLVTEPAPVFLNDVTTLYCPQDITMEVRYTETADHAELTALGVVYQLTSVVSASGARYTNESGTALWEHQGEVNVSLPGESQARLCVVEQIVKDDASAASIGGLITVTAPVNTEVVGNPVMITGEARGYWFFEATAPVVVTNWDGLIIGEGYIEAEGDWMTEDFVPFSGSVTYDLPADTYSTRGLVILQRANPSGMPENAAAIEILVELVPTAAASSSAGSADTASIACTDEQKTAQVCTQEYAPVCGVVDVQCVTTPCDPVLETFSNSCTACGQGSVDSYTKGACSVAL